MCLWTQVVEAFGNRCGQDSLFELLFGQQASSASSFIANDDIRSIKAMTPQISQLAGWDAGTKLERLIIISDNYILWTTQM